MAADSKVVIGLTHGAEKPERVLIAHLMGLEAVRAGKQALMWLTEDGVFVGTKGYIDDIVVEGAPSIAELQDEFIERGGKFYACPVCVKTHGAEGSEWVATAEVKGVPSLFEFSEGGALTFNY